MAIRLRSVDGVLIAVCAARSVAMPGDMYLDDGQHMALARKFWLDYPACGVVTEPEIAELIEREESNNAGRAWWETMYGAQVGASAALAETPPGPTIEA